MAEDNDDLISADNWLTFWKWFVFAIVFWIVTYLAIITQDISSSDPVRNFAWLYGVATYFLIMIGSFIRNQWIKDKDGDRESEGFFEFIPNTILTLVMFMFFISALIFRMKRKEIPGGLGIRVQGGGSRKLKGGSESKTIRLEKIEHSAVIMVIIGIIAALINTFSNIYIWMSCSEDGCDDDNKDVNVNMIHSLVGAQINTIIMAFMALSIFVFYTKKYPKINNSITSDQLSGE